VHRSSDWLYGSLDLLILRTLALGPAHGFGISTWIRQRTGEALVLEDAALYKALHRLERQDLVASTWGLSENNRQAKYYRLTSGGRQALRSRQAAWREWVELMDTVLAPA